MIHCYRQLNFARQPTIMTKRFFSGMSSLMIHTSSTYKQQACTTNSQNHLSLVAYCFKLIEFKLNSKTENCKKFTHDHQNKHIKLILKCNAGIWWGGNVDIDTPVKTNIMVPLYFSYVLQAKHCWSWLNISPTWAVLTLRTSLLADRGT